MKRMTWVLVAVLCSSALMYAGGGNDKDKQGADAGKAKSMTGMICNSKCVKDTGGKSSCSKDCSEKTGAVVFVDSKGAMYKIDNQDKAMSMAGKKVKVKGSMMGKDMMHIDDIAPATY